MKRGKFLLASLACAASVGFAGTAFGLEPPTPQELQAKIQEFMQWYQSDAQKTRADMAAHIEKVFADLDFSELDLNGIRMLQNYVSLSPKLTEKMNARVASLKDEGGPDAVGAMIIDLGAAMQAGPEAYAAKVKEVVSHDAFGEALEKGYVDQFLGSIAYMSEDVAKASREELIAMSKHFGKALPARTAGAAAQFAVALHKFPDVFDKATREQVRQRVLESVEAAMNDAQDQGLTNYLAGQKDMLNSTYGRGELIGNDAPDLYFNWSTDKSLKTLDDLKGKVVVLDFWATWCGPCIASFPNVRELQDHYKGYPVEIIGVTSLQGKHYPRDGRAPIDTEGDPEKEYGLMPEFMESQNMTWTVAFSEQQVYNPEYGVRGIPHVAIIDSEGKIRYNGLHPARPLAEKTSKIDKLLKEAGLPYPGQKDEKKTPSNEDK